MRQIASLLLPLAALLPQPLAAQVLPPVLAYAFDFAESEAATVPAAEPGSERVIAVEAPVVQASQSSGAPSAYGVFRVLDDRRAALMGITGQDSVAHFEALLRDHPGIATIEMVDCPGTEDDRANLRLGRLIRAKGLATHVPANGFVASGAVELYLAGRERSADRGAEFAVHSWEDDSGREPADYAADAPQNRAYLDYYQAMGMSDGQARSFYAMTNSVPFSNARWLSADEMDRWARFDAPAAVQPATVRPAAIRPAAFAVRPRTVSYGPFRVVSETRAAMVGITNGATPAAFSAMLRDHPGIATIDLVECPGTDDDRANLRLGRLIRDKGIATHVPANGWVASGAVELFLAGARKSAEPSARFVVHSWEDDTGRGPGDYSLNAPKNRSYLDYYRAMGMSEREARDFYAMTNSVPFSRARWLTTAELARWTRIDRTGPATAAPRGRFAQAEVNGYGMLNR